MQHRTKRWVGSLVWSLSFTGLVSCASNPPPAGVVYVESPPPAERVEAVTVAPGPQYGWVGGYWTWSGNQYAWVPGHWVVPDSGRHRWVRGHWAHYKKGWYWVDGHWR